MGTYILNKYQAPKFVLDIKKYNVMVRITNPGEDFISLTNEEMYRDILELHFYDFVEEQNNLTIINDNHLDAILEFFNKNKNCDNMVIHCDMGISRSAGVAVGWFIFNNDRASIYKIYHGSKHIPNRLVVKKFAVRLNMDMKYINKWENEKFEKLTKF